MNTGLTLTAVLSVAVGCGFEQADQSAVGETGGIGPGASSTASDQGSSRGASGDGSGGGDAATDGAESWGTTTTLATATGSGGSTSAVATTGGSSSAGGDTWAGSGESGAESGTDETGGSVDGRVADGLLVLYRFDEMGGSTVNDSSGVGVALDLTIEDPLAVAWQPAGGLTVFDNTIIESIGPASKVIEACRATDAITVEAWVRPQNTAMTGPARIVTLSADTGNRNFTVGQQNNDYAFRLRTDSGGNDNGTSPQINSNNTLGTELSHVVFTRSSDGTAQAYVDGLPMTTSPASNAGTFANWNESYTFALADESGDDNRFWHGAYFLVAVYDRALTEAEVVQNFDAAW